MMEVTLEYKRQGTTMLSEGKITYSEGDFTSTVPFAGIEYKPMMAALSTVLRAFPDDTEVKVLIQRTDRAGLQPYTLDDATVQLLRNDPVAGIQALSISSPRPAQVLDNIKKAQRPPIPLAPLRAGSETMADAFGEKVAFKVRGHELECPGCGFWSIYTTPGLLNDPERAGLVFKTAFVCRKKCCQRFIVSCHKEWGFVDVEDLLKTVLPAFYLPRVWNNRRPWISRADLEQKYNEYKKEKESV